MITFLSFDKVHGKKLKIDIFGFHLLKENGFQQVKTEYTDFITKK